MCLSLMPAAIFTADAADLPELQNVRLSSDGMLTFDPFITMETSKVIYYYSVSRTQPSVVSGGGYSDKTTFDVKAYIDGHDWGEGTYTVSITANTNYGDSGSRALTQTWKGSYLYYSDSNRDLGVWVKGQQFTMRNAATGIPSGSGVAALDTTTSPFTVVLDNAVINTEHKWVNSGIEYYCGIFGSSNAPNGVPDINVKVIGNCTINVSEKTGLYKKTAVSSSTAVPIFSATAR